MISPLFTIANFSPKIEWLADQSASIPVNAGWSDVVKWIWMSLPDYTPLPTEYTPSLMTEDDVVEEERLMNQDKLMAFLNVWLSRMVEEDNSMREKVALFWHHHIPCGTGHSVDHVRLLLEIYREHGLGNLRDLLVAVAANPAMMYFLDGHHAHKDNPNENFSRELMEIFTLGEGAYTLQDVKEAARAFTGRRFDHDNYPYKMYVDESAQDKGVKTIFGKSGYFNGEDVIDLILEQPQTAIHITRSVVRFFLTEQPADQLVSDCAEVYRQSGYSMQALLNAVFTHSETQTVAAKGSRRVKTPVELLVGLQRQTGLRTVGMKTNQLFLRLCGQSLFFPPNVAGWPGGKDWFRGERVFHRLFLPGVMFKICNRNAPRNSLIYKLGSRLLDPDIREVRFVADARWNEQFFYETLKRAGLSVAEWLTGKPADLTALDQILHSPEYQYC